MIRPSAPNTMQRQDSELKRYAPTHYLSSLLRTYEGNIAESDGITEANTIIQRFTEYMRQQDRIIAIHKSPLRSTVPDKSSASASAFPSASSTPELTNNKPRIANLFLDRFPEWTYDYEYYPLSSYRDPLVTAFMQTFDIEFNFATAEQQSDWIKQAKFDILMEFHKNGIYQSHSYSASSDFKKSDLEDVFTTNKPIPIEMIRVFADVFGIYLIWITSDGILHCPSKCTNTKNVAWILVEDANSGWYVLYPPKDAKPARLYFQYRDVMKYVRSVTSLPITSTTLNLDELQLWSRLYGIDHKKQGKTGKRNKLKEELVAELNQVSL